jgi:hypothetical protein
MREGLFFSSIPPFPHAVRREHLSFHFLERVASLGLKMNRDRNSPLIEPPSINFPHSTLL